MYEMKGALSGDAAPDDPVTRSASSGSPVAQRSGSSPASRPASPAPGPAGPAGFPGTQFARLPAAPAAARWSPSPPALQPAGNPPTGAVRPPPVPGTRGKTRFPGLSPAPGEPRMRLFPTVNVSLRPCARRARACRKFIPGYSHPHIVHRTAPVIRMSQRLSTALCTYDSTVTRRNSKNYQRRWPDVIDRALSGDIRLITNRADLFGAVLAAAPPACRDQGQSPGAAEAPGC